MRFQTVRVTHRIVVDWVAETFHLPTDTAQFHAEARARARTMAYALNRREMRHHAPRRARVLKGWQAWIGHTLGADTPAPVRTDARDGEAR
jgi:hypothetical protein